MSIDPEFTTFTPLATPDDESNIEKNLLPNGKQPALNITILQQILATLRGEQNVLYERSVLPKDSTFTNEEVGIRDYNLVLITTDGSINTISYDFRTKEGNMWKPASTIEARNLPIMIGQLDTVRINNDTAESGKSVFVDRWLAPSSMLSALSTGTILKTGVGIAGITEMATLKETSKAINTDWLAANITPNITPCMHRLFIKVATATGVRVELDDSGESTTDVEFYLNSKSNLAADAGYTFDVPLLAGQSYNIQHDTGTQNVYIHIIEYPNFTG
jgi:hypothetical protein